MLLFTDLKLNLEGCYAKKIILSMETNSHHHKKIRELIITLISTSMLTQIPWLAVKFRDSNKIIWEKNFPTQCFFFFPHRRGIVLVPNFVWGGNGTKLIIKIIGFGGVWSKNKMFE